MTGNDLPKPYDYPFAGESEAHCPWCRACLDDMPVRLGDIAVALDCLAPDQPEARLTLTADCSACGHPVSIRQTYWFGRSRGVEDWCGCASAERTETDRAFLRKVAGVSSPQGP